MISVAGISLKGSEHNSVKHMHFDYHRRFESAANQEFLLKIKQEVKSVSPENNPDEISGKIL